MPLQQTSGNVTADAYGGGVAAVPNYIEDVFSTYLYKGNGSTQTITNGIDLSTKGGLVWTKSRSSATSHYLIDTVRGKEHYLLSNSNSAQDPFGPETAGNGLTSFNTTGYSIGPNNAEELNFSGQNEVSWTFRKQLKFFDVLTWTGDGTSGRAIPHNLGSTPGCFIIKCTSNTADWIVYHSALGVNSNLLLNDTSSAISGNNFYNGIAPTSTNIYVGSSTVGSNAYVNQSGRTYVAYLYASNAGGFGLTGTDNVISCGSYTGNGSSTGPTVTLGYEPQWLLVKNATSVRNWFLVDNMRGLTVGGVDPILQPNSSSAEQSSSSYDYFSPTATGFSVTNSDGDVNASGDTYIYIAIRRGPMKVPTDATKVFAPVTATTPSSPYTVTTNFPVDLAINCTTSSSLKSFNDRLRGGTTNSYVVLRSTSTAAEATGTGFGISFDSNTSIIDNGWQSGAGANPVYWNFKRAPSFFDEVCYTGTGSATTLSDNLQAVPELIIVKKRSAVENWCVYSSTVGNTGYLVLNTALAPYATSSTIWNNTSPTASVFSVGTNSLTNSNGATYVAYLFATCAGVSKVGSYTGTGATQTISCGFTGGARFVLVKRTDTTGDWYVWDTARGMVSGTDPSLLLNSTAAEVNANSIYTTTGGFQIVSTAAGINASGGTYIFLAIA